MSLLPRLNEVSVTNICKVSHRSNLANLRGPFREKPLRTPKIWKN